MDGTANMYLALAAIIGAGLHGIENAEPLDLKDSRIDPPAKMSPEERGALGFLEKISKSIGEALECLEEDEVVKGFMGREMVEAYGSVKRAEEEMLNGMEEGRRRYYLVEKY